MIGQHLILRLEDDEQLAKTEAKRAILARVIHKAARPFELLAFALPDTHLHLENVGRDGAELARRVQIALHKALSLAVPFVKVRPRPIRNQWHLQNTFTYILEQQTHHGLANDPLHVGSCLPDVLGLRVTGPRLRRDVERWLPRLHPGRIAERLGVPLVEADGPLELLSGAAAAAVGLTSLTGRSALAVAARRAALAVLGSRVSQRQAAGLLGVGVSTARRLSRMPASASLVRAVRLQLGLRRERWAAALPTG